MSREVQPKLANQTEIQDALVQFLKEEPFKCIIAYIIIRVNKKLGIKHSDKLRLEGVQFADIIQNVSLSFLNTSGGRNWNKTAFPEFKKQFYSALDSEIFNTLRKYLAKANAKVELTECDDVEESFQIEDNNYLDEVYDKLIDLGATEEELDLFEPLVIDQLKRDEIAKRLNIAPTRVTTIKKRLTRKLITILKDKNTQNHEKKYYTNPNQQLYPE